MGSVERQVAVKLSNFEPRAGITLFKCFSDRKIKICRKALQYWRVKLKVNPTIPLIL